MPRKDIYKDAVPFKRQGDIAGDIPLAAKTLGVRLPVDVDAAIRALPEPTAWVREVLINAAKRELLGGTVSENLPPSPHAKDPLTHRGELMAVVDELLSIPRLPKEARALLEQLRQSLRD